MNDEEKYMVIHYEYITFKTIPHVFGNFNLEDANKLYDELLEDLPENDFIELVELHKNDGG